LLMSQFGLAHKKLAPDPSRLLPISKLKSMPSQNLQAALGAVVALPVVLWLLYMVISKNALTILLLPLGSFKGALSTLAGITMQLGYYGMAFLLGWGVIDFFRQARRRSKELRMTKQEVRDEWKQNEGSPEVKGRIRQLRRDLLRRRMMSEVKTASVIVVNPTHYAVAIRYNMQGMAAPKVVAKGKNFLALRIRELAQEHLVPIVENKPLARALYAECEVGQEIPFQLYRAVAEVLAYVFRVSGGRTNG
jgi:flagellar biosynthetic protein FlhB